MLKETILMKMYRKIWYFENGNVQIARVVGKGPEIMAGIFLFEKVSGVILTSGLTFIIGLTYLISCFIIGVIYKKSGLYDKERTVQANQDPIQKEMLENTRKIKSLLYKSKKMM